MRTRGLVVAAAMVVVALWVAPAGASAAAWSAQSVPAPEGPTGSLVAISCPTGNGCAAVGSYDNPAGLAVPLAKVGSGAQWINVPVPSPAGSPSSSLSAVSCTPSGTCMAVGSSTNASGITTPLAEQSVGVNRSIVATPSPAGASVSSLSGVSCTAASDCVAVGRSSDNSGSSPLIEHWDGSRWSIVSAAEPAGGSLASLSAVSCSSASACTAVGNYNTSDGTTSTLAERWDGRAWAVQATDDPAGASVASFSGVSCASSTSCTAVGGVNLDSILPVPLVEHWNGSAWTLQQTPDLPPGDQYGSDSQLVAVSCLSSSDCVAVGSTLDPQANGPGQLIERWDGSAWTVQATASSGGATEQLFGVACTAANACTTVGTRQSPDTSGTLIEHWSGTSWSAQTSPDPNGATPAALSAASCASAAVCVAVGGSLSERFDGSAWSMRSVAVPAGDVDVDFLAVSCTSPAACLAVGNAGDSSFAEVTLAEAWNGSIWTVMPTPSPAGGENVTLNGVSCTAGSACTAVGGYFDTVTGNEVTLVERWNGTSWAIQPTPNPAGTTSSQLAGVSCTSSTACTAVGHYFNGSDAVPLVETWNGTTWTIRTAAGLSTFSELNGVSCTADSACTAVGFSLVGPLAERWNGTTWTLQPTPSPAGVTNLSLSAVSCTTSTACTAVGSGFAGGSGSDGAVAEAWNGTGWAVQSTPTPYGAAAAGLSGVSCVAGPVCEAVGSANRTVQVPLAVRYG
jgi:hypothetical protein